MTAYDADGMIWQKDGEIVRSEANARIRAEAVARIQRVADGGILRVGEIRIWPGIDNIIRRKAKERATQ